MPAFGMPPNYWSEEGGNTKLNSWFMTIREKISSQYKFHYPAKKPIHISLSCKVDSNGLLSDIQLVKSSGNTSLDKSAIAFVRSISPVSKPPEIAISRGINISFADFMKEPPQVWLISSQKKVNPHRFM